MTEEERGDRACVCFMCGIIPDERHSVRGQRSLVIYLFFFVSSILGSPTHFFKCLLISDFDFFGNLPIKEN